jgi:hypothetical protein
LALEADDEVIGTCDHIAFAGWRPSSSDLAIRPALLVWQPPNPARLQRRAWVLNSKQGTQRAASGGFVPFWLLPNGESTRYPNTKKKLSTACRG